MDITPSNRIQKVKPSPTLAVTALAAKLRAEGRDVIGLAAGEPDFDTPDHVKQAAIKAINEGFTKYTAVDGMPSLKQAIINKFEKDNGLSYATDQILVSCGGKQSFYNLAQALLNPGDEVIIPTPYWVSYPDMVLLADAEPVIVQGEQEQGFKITAAQLEAAITDKTRLFVINSPSNPSGKAYTLTELKALGDVLLKHPNIIIATDDMYEHIIWTEEGFCNILNACPELYERTIVLNGVSKAYAMTGWRIGYAGGPADLIKGMKKVQSQSTSNPTSISQVAAQAALEGDQSRLIEMNTAFKQRHDYVLSALNSMDGVSSLASDGTFYIFPDFRQVMDRMGISDDVKLGEKLLADAEVALVPGSAFGSPGHMRISFATDMGSLEKALERIGNFIR
ncbi:MAG: pyridoxal phosphate-dependent aminotransferase [Gammaproteobacteria bacterium]|nr:pyridoxal phosphate-dependent aminotransferase [Gammaproteobacteria bacterium]MCW9004645.1 pyridoxal phosphate-dependent aminotransferase [Gammaproteobacteria bacterium]